MSEHRTNPLPATSRQWSTTFINVLPSRIGLCFLFTGLYGIVWAALHSSTTDEWIADSPSIRTLLERAALNGDTNHVQLASDSILRNQSQFDRVVSYYAAISRSNHPNSSLELNEQYVPSRRYPLFLSMVWHLNEYDIWFWYRLFCPIVHSRSLHVVGSESDTQQRILEMLYRNQFVDDCTDPHHKYLILVCWRLYAHPPLTTQWFCSFSVLFRISLISPPESEPHSMDSSSSSLSGYASMRHFSLVDPLLAVLP